MTIPKSYGGTGDMRRVVTIAFILFAASVLPVRAGLPPLSTWSDRDQLMFVNGFWGGYMQGAGRAARTIGAPSAAFFQQVYNDVGQCRAQYPNVVQRIAKSMGTLSPDDGERFNNALEAVLMKCGREKW